MKKLSIMVDMEMYRTGNTAIGNSVSVLYLQFTNHIHQSSFKSYDDQRKLELSFKQIVKAIQNTNSPRPKFGIPGECENEFEILSRNAASADIKILFKILVDDLLSFLGFELLEIDFQNNYSLLDTRELHIIKNVIQSDKVLTTFNQKNIQEG